MPGEKENGSFEQVGAVALAVEGEVEPDPVGGGVDDRHAEADRELLGAALDVQVLDIVVDHVGAADLAEDVEAQVARGQRHRVVEAGLAQALGEVAGEHQRVVAPQEVEPGEGQPGIVGADAGRLVVGGARLDREPLLALLDRHREPRLPGCRARQQAGVELGDGRVLQQQLQPVLQVVDVERRPGPEPDALLEKRDVQLAGAGDVDRLQPALDDRRSGRCPRSHPGPAGWRRN